MHFVIICFTSLLLPTIFSCTAFAAKMPPLVEIEDSRGNTHICPPENIWAVYFIPELDLRKETGHVVKSNTVHIWGCNAASYAETALPHDVSEEQLLDRLGIKAGFIALTSTAPAPHKLFLKASAIVYIAPAAGEYTDKRIKTEIYPGPRSSAGWQVFETPSEVERLVNEQRVREEAQ
jgi:hypothetical protein